MLSLGLSLDISYTSSQGASGIPLDVILFNGVALVYNGEFLIYN